jgi:hypothetical protein
MGKSSTAHWRQYIIYRPINVADAIFSKFEDRFCFEVYFTTLSATENLKRRKLRYFMNDGLCRVLDDAVRSRQVVVAMAQRPISCPGSASLLSLLYHTPSRTPLSEWSSQRPLLTQYATNTRHEIIYSNFRIAWPCIVINSLRIKPADALSSNFIIGNNNPTCFGQSFCPSSGASQPYNGIGTIYAARWPSGIRIRTSWCW